MDESSGIQQPGQLIVACYILEQGTNSCKIKYHRRLKLLDARTCFRPEDSNLLMPSILGRVHAYYNSLSVRISWELDK